MRDGQTDTAHVRVGRVVKPIDTVPIVPTAASILPFYHLV